MYLCTSEIIQKANTLVKTCGTRDPHRIAKELGVEILYCPFARQRGALKILIWRLCLNIAKRLDTENLPRNISVRTMTLLLSAYVIIAN